MHFALALVFGMMLIVKPALARDSGVDDAAYDAAYAECTSKAEAAGDGYFTIFDACMSAKGFHATPPDGEPADSE